jgi:hypothetical protein
MWIGAIRVLVQTKDARFVATESRVRAAILRNGNSLRILKDPPGRTDLEPGAIRTYCDLRARAARASVLDMNRETAGGRPAPFLREP